MTTNLNDLTAHNLGTALAATARLEFPEARIDSWGDVHDLCDANMLMLEVIMKVTGLSEDDAFMWSQDELNSDRNPQDIINSSLNIASSLLAD